MMTSEQLADFQRTHRDHLGRPLKADGQLGPLTQWALDLSALGPRGLAVAEALSYVGLTEVGVNRGPEIDAWVLRCGVPLGSPWCAAFACAMILHSGVNLHLASVAALSKALPHVDGLPLPGDFGCWVDADGTGHVWIWSAIEGVEGLTVEGNSNNGVRVWRRRWTDFTNLRTLPLPGVLLGATAKARGGQTR